MIRTLIFMCLMSMSILISSCCYIIPCCGGTVVKPLDQPIRERLKLVKKEAESSIILTTEKVKLNEVDFHVGKKIVDTLTKTIRQIDSLITISVQLGKTGTKEELLFFAEHSDRVTRSTLTNLKSLRDLYDISTYSQFETDSFFPADSFNISPEKMNEAKKAIEPVAQRIVRFFADHPQQKFEAVIACSSTPDGQELNDKLCKARARSVAYLLVDQIRSQKEFIPKPERIRYNIKWVDQKEALPSRGMVSIIWNLIPATVNVGSSDH
jgi:hypothetical protein